jgi:hypothetical protein
MSGEWKMKRAFFSILMLMCAECGMRADTQKEIFHKDIIKTIAVAIQNPWDESDNEESLDKSAKEDSCELRDQVSEEITKKILAMRKVEENEWNEYVRAQTDDELTSVVKKWKTTGVSIGTVISLISRTNIPGKMLSELDGPQNFPKERTSITTKHDLSLFRGENTWTLEQLLECKFPPVVASTSQETMSTIRKMAWERINEIKKQSLVEEDTSKSIDFSKCSKKEKLKLASAPDSSDATLSHLSKEDDVEIRRTVAKNPNTPYFVQHFLRDDCDSETSAIARRSKPLTMVYSPRYLPDLEFIRDKKLSKNK